ncbi:MAG TPA: hypothetical protein VGF13_10460 [Verrucomicrobiae bacterium]
MENVNNTSKGKCAIYVVSILATFLLMVFLVKQMVKVTHPAPIGAERATARAKDTAEIRAAGANAAVNWGYANQPNGIVRLPMDEAMKITVQGYQNAADFRKDLLARSEKASALPPKVKSDFE